MKARQEIRRQASLLLSKRLTEEEFPLIQVLIGPRQVGKTTAVHHFLEDESRTFPAHKVHFATPEEELSPKPDWIEAQWRECQKKGGGALLIIDEVQKIEQWSWVVKHLWDKQIREVKKKSDRLKVVLLGSSSLKLQSGLKESLAGRFELIKVPHWSFEESQEQFGLDLDRYLVFGGYPGSYLFLKDLSRWFAYISDSIIESVIGRDILAHQSVQNPVLFRQCFDLLCAYPAQELSYTKLLGQLQSSGNVEIVKRYIELFEGAFFFRSLQKYSGSRIKKKTSSPKILPSCGALAARGFGIFEKNQLQSILEQHRGRLLEVAVGNVLAKLPGQLYYWRDGNDEVDYVYTHGPIPIAIEVKSGKLGSLSGLNAFAAHFPKCKKIVVTYSDFPNFSKNPKSFLGIDDERLSLAEHT